MTGRDTSTPVVLAIDLGTTGLKLAYVGLDGSIRARAHRSITTTLLPGGGATQDPHEWWRSVVDAARELCRDCPAAGAAVTAVTCTGQWGSTVPVDADGYPAGDCLLWLDQRGAHAAARQLGGAFAVQGYRPRAAIEWIRRAGGAPNPGGNDPLGHRLWIAANSPDVVARLAHFMEPVDYLNLRLCGQVAATQVTTTLWWLTDNRILDATVYDPTLLRLAGARAEQLPPLIPSRAIVGEVSDRVAAELGIPRGTPVTAGLPDLHSSALGSGALGPREGHIAISTSAWIGAYVPFKKTSLRRQMATVPSGLPGQYLLANNHDSAGSALSWLRDHVLGPVGDGQDSAPGFADLDSLAADVPAGAHGVMFTPWLHGLRCPARDSVARAGFTNLGFSNNQADLVRAVLEGVAHQVRWLLEASEKVVRGELTNLRMIGGGARSDVWCQIHADVLGRRVTRTADPLYAAVRGAGLFGAIATGQVSPESAPGLVPVDQVFEPEPLTHRIYDDKYRRFRKLARA